jgi:predicted dehydrogenase
MIKSQSTRIGVVGYGYWGPNIARNVRKANGTTLVAIVDQSPSRRTLARSDHPEVEVFSSIEDLLSMPNLDAVAISTPVMSHEALALRALGEGKHVFIEKPLAGDLASACRIADLARDRALRVMVDHTFLYTGAVREISRRVASGQLGDLLYFDSCRVNLGLIQDDVDVVWDLAVHDVAILNHLRGQLPLSVSAVGAVHQPSTTRSAAYLTMTYSDDFVAHLNVNWMSPVKLRRVLIGGSDRMIVWDDVEPSEKVKVYESRVERIDDPDSQRAAMVQYRIGDVFTPRLDGKEALELEFETFGAWIRGSIEDVPNSVNDGVDVIRVLAAATESMDRGGMSVAI